MSTKDLLAEGLRKGFAGSTQVGKLNRGSFELTSSHVESELGTYHDEWVKGGGQEIAKTLNGESITRVYVGDTISEEKLAELGITQKDIMIFLKEVITLHAQDIRFDTDFETSNGDFKYSYKVTYKNDDPFIINGIEQIYFKETCVFIHTFAISKVVEA